MKTIKINVNHVGKYSIGGSGLQHCFKMSIYDGKEVVEYGGQKCIVSFTIDEENADQRIINSTDMDNLINNLVDIIGFALKHAECIISSTNYKAQLFAFLKCYREHFHEIDGSLRDELKEIVKKQIKDLEAKISLENIVPSPGELMIDNYVFFDKTQKLKRIIKSSESKLLELKEDSNSYQSELKFMNKLKAELSEIEDLIQISDAR
jgi:hypothetical protein